MVDNEPEAYRIGNIPFLGLTIYLDSHPLIPRPETEWWTEELVRELDGALSGDAYFSAEKSLGLAPTRSGTSLKTTTELAVLDLCAGSGAIGCAILKYVPNAQVYFCEIDPTHKETISKNIRENKLDESRAEIRIGDLFEPFGDLKFDYIAANPPYVPEGRTLDASVEDFEPSLALRAGHDGLAIIRRIITELPRRLKRGGAAWIECDLDNIDEAKHLAETGGLEATIRNDQYDRPRILVVSFKNDRAT